MHWVIRNPQVEGHAAKPVATIYCIYTYVCCMFPSGLENLKNVRAFSSRGKVLEFYPKYCKSMEKLLIGNFKKLECLSDLCAKIFFNLPPLGMPILIFTESSVTAINKWITPG